MDKEILEKFLGKDVVLITSENYVNYGQITRIYDHSIALYIKAKHKIVFFDFSRIAELRPQKEWKI